MQKLVTVTQIQLIEQEADALGVTSKQLMQNAGRSLAEVIQNKYEKMRTGGACGLVGSGNNGGDTLVALAHLAALGWRTCAYLVGSRPEGDPLVTDLLEKGVEIYQIETDPGYKQLGQLLTEYSILLDGVLGTGFRLPLKSELSEVLAFVRDAVGSSADAPLVVAVDCPSGVDCESGAAAGEVIPADLTVTMAAIKIGLLKLPAYRLAGEVVVADIGLPDHGQNMETWQAVKVFVPDRDWIRTLIPDRPLTAHKGTFGTALIIAGSTNFTGAAWLAGQAAHRIGAGMVTLAVPESVRAALAGSFPEATWIPLPENDGYINRDADQLILEQLDRVTAILLGPGLGQAPHTAQFIEHLFKQRSQKAIGFIDGTFDSLQPTARRLPPMVVDADGLTLLKGVSDWHTLLSPQTILTPHPGEMSILTGLRKETIQSDRINIASKFSQEWGHIVVLKGAFTVIASPDGQAAVIPIATPALARAGSGDVLAGIIAGLLAQGVHPFEAAVVGAWIHGRAGLLAAKMIGNDASVLAGDLIQSMIRVISTELNQNVGRSVN